MNHYNYNGYIINNITIIIYHYYYNITISRSNKDCIEYTDTKLRDCNSTKIKFNLRNDKKTL